MTAVPGFGALVLPPDGGFDPPPVVFEPLPDDDEAAGDFSSLTCCAKGSLLAKRLNDVSWPSASVGAGTEASDGSVDGLELGAWLPPLSVGAARLGVPVVAVFVSYDARCTDFGGCICFQTRGPWNASTPTNTTPSPAATIFCFFCFALSGSTVFLAITAPLSRTHCSRASRWSSSRSRAAPGAGQAPAPTRRRRRRSRASPGSGGTSARSR